MLILCVILMLLAITSYVCADILTFPGANLLPWVLGALSVVCFLILSLGKRVTSNKSAINKQFVDNLLQVCLADGKVSENEVSVIKTIMALRGMKPLKSESEIKKYLENCSMFVVPTSVKEREIELKCLIFVMIADGVPSENECRKILDVAKKYGYTNDQVKAMIEEFKQPSFVEKLLEDVKNF